MGAIKRAFYNNILGSGKFDATDLTGTIPDANINGITVQAVSSDPPSPTEGQIWYNTTTDKFRIRATFPGSTAFASGGTMNTPGVSSLANIGNSTAAIAAGGYSTTVGYHNNSEEYNGSSWTATPNLNQARRETESAFGTATAGVVAGGYQPPGSPSAYTEEWNGSSWTAGGALGNARYSAGGLGIATAGLCFGGNHPVSVGTSHTEEYDGSSWTSGGNVPEAHRNTAGFGTQTAGVQTCGQPQSPGVGTVKTAHYDGSSWTAANNSNIARRSHGAAGTAQTAGINVGGDSPGGVLNTSESYDGTSWTSGPNTAVPIGGGFTGGGSATDAIFVSTPSNTAQEFTQGSPAVGNGDLTFTSD